MLIRRLIPAFAIFLVCFLGSLLLDGSYSDARLRKNIAKIQPGMSEEQVIKILGKPTARAISDIPGTYWSYRTDPIYQLIDDNPDNMGYLALEMSSDGKVVRVFDLK